MATDHGEVLTKFEEMFGTLVEHEVIKLVLQSCDWNATLATDNLLAMIDKNELPPHTLSALTAESLARSIFEGSNNHHSVGSGVTQKNPATSSPGRRRYDDGMSGHGSDYSKVVGGSAQANVNGRVRVDSFNEGLGSPSHYSGKGVLDTTEETPSPSFSPLKHAPSESDARGYGEAHSSRWVLAPEFVPNALHRNAPANSNDMKSGIWPRAISSSLVGVAKSNNSQQSKSQLTGKSKLSKNNHIRDKIQMGKKLMVLMRGLPGSGKTTMAKGLKGRSGVILSADDFFCDRQGNYIYDQTKIGAAHEWNKRRTIQRLKEGKNPVIIDNTNLEEWEMLPYVKLALQCGYEVELMESDTPWKLNPKELARRNTHGVPKAKIAEMKQRYQQGVKTETLLRTVKQADRSKDGQENCFLDELNINYCTNSNSHIEHSDLHDEKQTLYDDQKYLEDNELKMKEERNNLYEELQSDICDCKLNTPYDEDDTTSDEQVNADDEKNCADDEKEGVYSEETEDVCESVNEKNEGVTEKIPSLEQIKDNYKNVDGGNCTENDDEEDADVIIEGYEDDGNVDILSNGDMGEWSEADNNDEFIVLEVTEDTAENTSIMNNSTEGHPTSTIHISATNASVNKFGTENDSVLNSTMENAYSCERKTENCNDCKKDSDSVLKELQEEFDDKLVIKDAYSGVNITSHTPAETLTAEVVESLDARIQRLIEEANQEADISHNESGWEDSFTQPMKDNVTDEKFVDLVNTLSSAMKKQVQEKEASASIPNGKGGLSSAASDTYNEDSAMYEFCRNMEEKTGKSLSTYLAIIGGEKVDIPFFDDQNQDSGLVDMEERSFSILDLPTTPPSDDKKVNLLEALVTTSERKEKDESTLKEVSLNVILEENITEAEVSTNDSQSLGTVLCEERTSAETQTHQSETGVDNESETVFGVLDSSSCSTDRSKPNSVDTSDMTKMEFINVDDNQNTVRVNETPSVQSPPTSMTSWECVDIKGDASPASWDSDTKRKEKDQDANFPKPSRATGRRARNSGDPLKWLKVEVNKCAEDPSVASWNPVESDPAQSWDTSGLVHTRGGDEEALQDDPQPHTGAVSKFRRKHNRSNSGPSFLQPDGASATQEDVHCKSSYRGSPSLDVVLHVVMKDAETQTLSIDFETVHLDNSLYELKVIYGKPNYIPKVTSLLTTGPLTTGKLRLEKGTMTDNMDNVIVVKPFKNLIAFFPNIPEENLHDVFEKCKYDLDWAMNVLLDSGYEMSDPTEPALIQDDPECQDMPFEMISTPETTSTSESRNDQSFADASDISDIIVEKRKKKVKQSKQPQNLAVKKQIEGCISITDSVNDQLLRLTGKNKEQLNMSKLKKIKKKKNDGRKSTSPKYEKPFEKCTESEKEGGAQYITLVMDPLFAAQLSRMFGPVGSSEFGGELTYEDRNVILPIDFCHTIHQYWKMTLEGKFRHEAQVLDSLIREDESLARRLQEEENAASGVDLSSKISSSDEGFHLDPPQQLQEIMDLEQALQLSKNEQQEGDESLSSRLNLQRLYTEYPHVDPVALREEFGRSGQNYIATVSRLTQRFGSEQGVPKTVIAPEALYRYEKQMVEQAQRKSLAQQQEEEEQDAEQDSEELLPGDPQVYRDEAQLHYYQRQEAYKKAQEASQQGMKAVAAYYARIGNLHAAKLTEANQRASQKILEATNANHQDANCLDLHLLHVPEAMSATQAFLSERMRILTARGMKQMEVSLITGRGAHSLGGQAKLKPAIKDFLHRNGYTFYEANAGMFTISLRA